MILDEPIAFNAKAQHHSTKAFERISDSDLVFKGGRSKQALILLPFHLENQSATSIGTLQRLDTPTPSLVIEIDSTHKLVLKGCLVKPKNTLLGLKVPAQKGADVHIVGDYESVLVFPECTLEGQDSIVQEISPDQIVRKMAQSARKSSVDSTASLSQDITSESSAEEDFEDDSMPASQESRKSLRRMSTSSTIKYFSSSSGESLDQDEQQFISSDHVQVEDEDDEDVPIARLESRKSGKAKRKRKYSSESDDEASESDFEDSSQRKPSKRISRGRRMSEEDTIIISD
jgi:hypothetical protein